MLREEWRLHRSFVGAVGSGFFPVMIFFFSLVLAATSPVLLRKMDVSLVLLVLHVSAALYGLGVGALAQIGEQVMTRRLGQVNMLLQLPALQPVRFRTVMGVFYAKDAVFYILYSIIPLVGGIAAAVPLSRITPGGVALLFVTVLLTFMLGMGLSFLLSAVALRSRAAAAAVALAIAGLVALVWPLRLLVPGQVLLPLGYWETQNSLYLLSAAAFALLLSAAAVLLMKERFAPPGRRFRGALLETERRFAFSKGLSALVAKEWLELRRSGALGPVFSGFLGPLLGVYAVIWLFRSGLGLPLEFNVVFYGGMLGFLGLMTYSWLTNIEPNEFLNVQPVGVDEVVRAKLVLYFLLTTPVSLVYLVAIGALNGECAYLPPGGPRGPFDHGLRRGSDRPHDRAACQHDALRRRGLGPVRRRHRPAADSGHAGVLPGPHGLLAGGGRAGGAVGLPPGGLEIPPGRHRATLVQVGLRYMKSRGRPGWEPAGPQPLLRTEDRSIGRSSRFICLRRES